MALQVEWVAARVQEQTALLEAKQPLTLSLDALRVGLGSLLCTWPPHALCPVPIFLHLCCLCQATLNQALVCSNSTSPMPVVALAM